MTSFPSTDTKKKLKNVGAINSDGTLNTALIRNKIGEDFAADARYLAEDGMKKRAVHMSKDYDEFKNFVACSQLKAVPHSEMNQLFVGGNAPQVINEGSRNLNKACPSDKTDSAFEGCADLLKLSTKSRERTHEKRKPKKTGGASSILKKEMKIPRSPMELQREWKIYCCSPEATIHYLLATEAPTLSDHESRNCCLDICVPTALRIIPEELCRTIFRVEIDPFIFEDIIMALHHLSSKGTILTSNEDKNTVVKTDPVLLWNLQYFVYRWMLALTECGRFSLTVEFLSPHQKSCLSEIFEWLKREDSSFRDENGNRNIHRKISIKDLTAIQKSFTL